MRSKICQQWRTWAIVFIIFQRMMWSLEPAILSPTWKDMKARQKKLIAKDTTSWTMDLKTQHENVRILLFKLSLAQSQPAVHIPLQEDCLNKETMCRFSEMKSLPHGMFHSKHLQNPTTPDDTGSMLGPSWTVRSWKSSEWVGDLVKLRYFTKRDYPEIRKILQLLFKFQTMVWGTSVGRQSCHIPCDSCWLKIQRCGYCENPNPKCWGPGFCKANTNGNLPSLWWGEKVVAGKVISRAPTMPADLILHPTSIPHAIPAQDLGIRCVNVSHKPANLSFHPPPT